MPRLSEWNSTSISPQFFMVLCVINTRHFYFYLYIHFWSWGNTVGRVTGLWAGLSGARDFCLHQNVQTSSGAHPASVWWVMVVISAAIRWLEHKVGQSPRSATDVNEWNCASSLSICYHGADRALPCAFYINVNKDTACNNVHFNDLKLHMCVSKCANWANWVDYQYLYVLICF